ncbi:MAG TPA: hypothetical protein VEJ23_02305 [Solirubrobacteraceae bacterium]|nr:hypothetical protein [Solirubrobacteraceae bacterium]
MSNREEAERVFAHALDPEIRRELWEVLQGINAAPVFTDEERGWSQQVLAVLDAIDLTRYVGDAIDSLSYAALAWATQVLQEMKYASEVPS